MKKLIIILILNLGFQSLAKAEDISNFEIEGVGIYESLLNFMTEEEIKKEEIFLYKSKKFASIWVKKNNSNFKLETYDNVTFSYKPNDKKYIIYSIEGHLNYKDDIENCYNQKKIIENELSNLFNIKLIYDNRDFSGDPSGESKVSLSNLSFDSESNARVICYDISQKLSDEKGWWDRLSVVINSKEFVNFLKNDAYN